MTGRKPATFFPAVSSIMLLVALRADAADHAGLKMRVAVMDMSLTATQMSSPTSSGGGTFTTTIQIPPPNDFAMALTEVLTTQLAKSGKFIVLERKALADIMAEQDLTANGKVNKETGAKSGGIIGATALIRCAISEYSFSQSGTSSALKVIPGMSLGVTTLRAVVGIDTRIYDAKTSEVLASTVARGTATSSGADVKVSGKKMDASAAGFMSTPLGRASREAIEGAVQFIIAKLGNAPWEARVIRADGGDIYLNAGEENGIKVGEKFNLYRAGEALIDPASGTQLGTPDTLIGMIVVKAVKPKYSVGEMVSGAKPERNDIVRATNQVANP
jgi:curli biogenesis system outer membrane secretion channel CsgG